MSTSQLLFVALFALVGLERGLELGISARNARRMRTRGALEGESRGFFAAMVAVHALFLVAAPLEALLLERPFLPRLGWPMLAVAASAMALRYWAIASLGAGWNTRVLVVPGDPLVDAGPYRFVRHPNYLAVIVEIAALPLVHTAWLTALAFSAANALLLRARIRHEELALARLAAPADAAPARPRFLPGLPGQPDAR